MIDSHVDPKAKFILSIGMEGKTIAEKRELVRDYNKGLSALFCDCSHSDFQTGVSLSVDQFSDTEVGNIWLGLVEKQGEWYLCHSEGKEVKLSDVIGLDLMWSQIG
jgi:hypothetical protein